MSDETPPLPEAVREQVFWCAKCLCSTSETTSTGNAFCRPCGRVFAKNEFVILTQAERCSIHAEMLRLAEAAAQQERVAWEAGFNLALSYGDNWVHFDGERRETQWRRYKETQAADLALATGELRVPLPEPGTDSARLLIANRLLKSELAAAQQERAVCSRCGGKIDGARECL